MFYDQAPSDQTTTISKYANLSYGGYYLYPIKKKQLLRDKIQGYSANIEEEDNTNNTTARVILIKK